MAEHKKVTGHERIETNNFLMIVLIIVAVTVCTVSRFRPTLRSVQRPPKHVPDRYFEVAHPRAAFEIRKTPKPGFHSLKVARILEVRDKTILFDESFAFQDSRARWLYTGITRAAKRLSVVV